MKHSHENALSTIAVRTAIAVIESDTAELKTKEQITKAASATIKYLRKTFPAVYTVDTIYSLAAFVLAFYGKKAVTIGSMTVTEYIALYAHVKRINAKVRNDLGAFGDLLEVLVRVALVKSINLVRPSMLCVRDAMKSDIVSKRYGVIEVGHNGKTLSEGTLFDAMAGKYTTVVYGVFSDSEKNRIYKACEEKNIEKALKIVCNNVALWSDKYRFEFDMNNLSRGQGIVIKSQGAQIVYNPSKYAAFLEALDKGIFPRLASLL